jgi:hypothetical protein
MSGLAVSSQLITDRSRRRATGRLISMPERSRAAAPEPQTGSALERVFRTWPGRVGSFRQIRGRRRWQQLRGVYRQPLTVLLHPRIASSQSEMDHQRAHLPVSLVPPAPSPTRGEASSGEAEPHQHTGRWFGHRHRHRRRKGLVEPRKPPVQSDGVETANLRILRRVRVEEHEQRLGAKRRAGREVQLAVMPRCFLPSCAAVACESHSKRRNQRPPT